ncbi:MAG: hypothetical protein AB7O37_02430 [Vicinamibacteria bacterium]
MRRGLALRLLLAVALHVFVGQGVLAPDEETYDSNGIRLARYWAGDSPFRPIQPFVQGEPRAYYFLVATQYLILGHWPLLPKLVNALCGAVTIRIVFDLALRVTGNANVALRAAQYSAFFPSLVLWSVLNIRDCWVVMMIVLICRQALRLQDRPGVNNALVLSLAIWALSHFRAYLLFAVTLPVALTFFVRGRGHVVRNVMIGMLAIAVIVVSDASSGFRGIDLQDLQRRRSWSASVSGSGFAAEADISTPQGAIAFLPVGLTYFFLAPFPWAITNALQALTLPEMLFFYSLLPSLVGGVRRILSTRLAESLMLALITAALSIGYAVGQGNVGTMYRHRSQVLPLLMIFVAVGKQARRQVAGSARATAAASPMRASPAQPRR